MMPELTTQTIDTMHSYLLYNSKTINPYIKFVMLMQHNQFKDVGMVVTTMCTHSISFTEKEKTYRIPEATFKHAVSYFGMSCCRCNCSGHCRNCSCVKSGKLCQGCLPQRLGNCTNTVVSTSNSQRVTTIPETPPGNTSASTTALDQSPLNTHDFISATTPWPMPALEPPNLSWDPYQGEEFCAKVNETYEEVIH